MIRVDKEEVRKSKITIYCKDKSVRILTSLGVYTPDKANELGKDLEGKNFFRAEALIL